MNAVHGVQGLAADLKGRFSCLGERNFLLTLFELTRLN
jgi:hypothetical protein